MGNCLLLPNSSELATPLPKLPMDLVRCFVSHDRLGNLNLVNKRHQSIRASHAFTLHGIEVVDPSTICKHLRRQVSPDRLRHREHCIRVPIATKIWDRKMIELLTHFPFISCQDISDSRLRCHLQRSVSSVKANSSPPRKDLRCDNGSFFARRRCRCDPTNPTRNKVLPGQRLFFLKLYSMFQEYRKATLDGKNNFNIFEGIEDFDCLIHTLMMFLMKM